MSVKEYLTEKFEQFFLSSKKVSKKNAEKNVENTTKTADPTQNDKLSGHTDFDPFNIFVNNFTIDLTNESLVKKWRQISRYPEVSYALEEIINEAIVMDDENEILKLDLMDVELPDIVKESILKRFEKILNLLEFDKNADKIFKKFYVDGCIIAELVYDKNDIKKGVVDIDFLTPINFIKVRNVRSNQIFYGYTEFQQKDFKNTFKDLKQLDNNVDENLVQKFYEEQIAMGVSGVFDEDRNLYLSYLNDCVRVVNQIYTIEDAIIIYRLTRAPEKRAFYIDVTGMNKTRAEQYIQSLMLKFKQRKVYDSETGSLQNKKKTVSLLEDFWFPTRSDAKGTKVETLTGQGEKMGTFEDLDYFVEKLYLALKVPRKRTEKDFSLKLDGGISDIEREEVKFTKFIKKLRRQFNCFLLDILKKDLIAAKVLKLEDWYKIKKNIKLIYSIDNHYAEAKELQLLEKRLSVIQTMGDYLPEDGKMYFSNKYVRNKILKHTEDEMKEFDINIKIEGGEVINYSEIEDEDGEKISNEKDVRKIKDIYAPNVEKNGEDASELEDQETSQIKEELIDKYDPNNIIEHEKFFQNLQEGDEIEIGNKTFIIENNEIIEK